MHQSTSSLKQELNEDTQVLETGYEPRTAQKTIHTNCRQNRFNVAVCHRRFGKTVAAINQLIHSALQNTKKNPQFHYIAPNYTQAKRVAWEYLKDYTRPLGGVANVAELRVNFLGRQISLHGADNPDSLRGIYSDGCVLDEYGNMRPELWSQVIRPALADRKGWALFIGTPMGDNHFKQLRDYANDEENKQWSLCEFKASETGIVDAEELKDAKREMGANRYNQEFEVSFDAPIVGSYYGEILNELKEQGRIRDIATDARTAKWTAWDLGMSDSTSIWVCETISGEIRVMDYYENAGQSLEHYITWLQEKGYDKYEHILPHDVEVRELGTGKSRKEMLEEGGLNITVAPKLGVEDGIQAVRQFLKNCYFHESTTQTGLNCLRNYRRQFNEKLNTYMEKPLHDWSSHCADAFRYLAIGLNTNNSIKRSDWSTPYDTTLNKESYKQQYI